MNTDEVAHELRRLTDQRDRGEIPGADYRVRRAALLDSLVGLAPPAAVADDRAEMTRRHPLSPGATEPPTLPPPVPPAHPLPAPHSPPASHMAPAAAAHAPAPRTASAADEPPTAPSQGGRAGLWVGVAVAVLAVAGLGFWFMSRPRAPQAADAPQAAGPATAPPAADSSATRDPVDDFLQRNDWSDHAISALNSAWWSLSDTEILATLASDSAKRLSAEVEARLRGRGTPGGPPQLDPDAPLVLLARNLNVPIPSAAVGVRTANEVAAAPVRPPPAPAAAPQKAAPAAAAAPAPAPAPAVRTAATTAPAPRPVPSDATARAAPAAPATGEPSAAANDACAEFYVNQRHRSCRDPLPGGRTGPDLVVVRPGHFKMGSPATAEEQPVHDVAILRPYALTVSEISVGDYKAFCGATGRACPTGTAADDLPVSNVSWNDARDYARWLSEATGHRYRLPSEAEWEYAARADVVGEPGKDLPAPSAATVARYAAPGIDRPSGPTQVSDSTFRLNAFGVRHMLGNVREWTQDAWSPDYKQATGDGAAHEAASTQRVVRGGSFHDGPEKVRPGAREPLDAGSRDAYTGFRLVREMRAP